MTRPELQALAERWMEFWRGGDLTDFTTVHAQDFFDHGAAGRPPDRDGLAGSIRALYLAFPDFYAVTEQMAVDQAAGLIAIVWRATGHQRGVFAGLQPTHRIIHFTGLEMIRAAGGQVVERWGEWDETAILRQLVP